MTRVRIDLQTPAAGGLRGAIGAMTWRPTSRHTAGDAVVLPAPFKVWLAGSSVEVDVEASGASWAWEVLEPHGGGRRTVAVPDSADPVEYADLVQVDPSTLEPTADPEAAWWALAGSTVTGGEVVGDNLVLRRTDGVEVNAGNVRGPAGTIPERVEAGALSAIIQAARTGYLLDDTGAVDGWTLTTPAGTGTLTAATDNGWSRLVMSAAQAGTSVRYGKEYAFGIPRGGALAIPIRRDANLSSIDIEVVVGSYSAGKTMTASMSVNNRAPVGVKYLLVVPLAQLAMSNPGNATLADAGRGVVIRVRATPLAGQTTTLEFGDIRVVGEPSAPPRVVWQFDDGRADTYSKAYPILAANGYAGSCAVEYGQVGTPGRVTLAQLQEMYAGGWEFLGHHNAQVPPLGTGGAANVFKAYRDWALGNGFTRGVSHWVWPGGIRDLATDAVRKRFYATGRGVSSQTNILTPYVFDPYDVPNVYIGSAGAVATYKSHLDRIKAFGGTVIFVFHSITDGDPTAPEDYRVDRFTELVEYARSLGIAGSSFDEALGTMSPSSPAR